MQTPGFGGKLVLPEHWLSAVQAPHLFMVVSQMGVVPEQLPSPVHCTHTLPFEQTGVPPTHWVAFVAEHCAQAPPARQAGAVALFALQAASPVHAMHLFAVLSQTGVAPEHCESLVHCTQTFVGEHAGRPASPTQSLSTPHSAQAPLVRQAGVAGLLALHCPTVHAEQTCVVVLQMGAKGDLQSVL